MLQTFIGESYVPPQRSPYQLLWLVGKPCDVKCLERKRVCAMIRDDPRDEQGQPEFDALRLRAVLGTQCHDAAATGKLDPCVHVLLRAVRAQWESDTQEAEGVGVGGKQQIAPHIPTTRKCQAGDSEKIRSNVNATMKEQACNARVATREAVRQLVDACLAYSGPPAQSVQNDPVQVHVPLIRPNR